MARGTIPITTLPRNGGTLGGSLAITAANGALIQAGGKTRDLFVYVKAGTVGGTISIVPGSALAPAFQAGRGTQTAVVSASADTVIAIESAFGSQGNGDLYLDFSSGMLANIYAYRLPADV